MDLRPAIHRGALAARFADGALGWEYPGADVLVRRVDGQTLPRGDSQLRPAAEIAGWLQWCDCGWEFRPWIRVADPAEQDLAARRVYSAHSSPPLETIGDITDVEWISHQDDSGDTGRA